MKNYWKRLREQRDNVDCIKAKCEVIMLVKRLREQRDNVDCIIAVCEVIMLVIAIFLIAIFS